MAHKKYKEKKLQIKERSMAFSLRNAAASLRKSTTISSLPHRRSFLKVHNNFGLAFSPTLYSSGLSQFNPKVGHRFSISASYGTGGQNVLDTAAPPKIENDEEPSRNWKIKMLYDGECPLCMKEVNMLKERDKSYGAIKFVDISSEEYSPEQNQGLDYKTVMGRIHAILSDGTVVKDVEAFRKLYEAVGLGWVYAITKYEPIATIADAVYGVWAKYRLQITGRPPLEEVVQARKNKELCNDSKTCKT